MKTNNLPSSFIPRDPESSSSKNKDKLNSSLFKIDLNEEIKPITSSSNAIGGNKNDQSDSGSDLPHMTEPNKKVNSFQIF